MLQYRQEERSSLTSTTLRESTNPKSNLVIVAEFVRETTWTSQTPSVVEEQKMV